MFAQNIDCVHVNDLPYFKGITYLPLLFQFVLISFNVPVTMLKSCRGGETASYVLSVPFWRYMYLAQGHNTATRVRIEPRPLTLDFDALPLDHRSSL